MINSNKPVVNSGLYAGKSQLNNLLIKNTNTLDNIKIREQMRSMQKARMTGKSQSVAKASRNKHLSENIARATVRPIIRKKTARDFANG